MGWITNKSLDSVDNKLGSLLRLRIQHSEIKLVKIEILFASLEVFKDLILSYITRPCIFLSIKSFTLIHDKFIGYFVILKVNLLSLSPRHIVSEKRVNTKVTFFC